MQLLEVHLLRYINDLDLNYHIDELQLLSEGEACINRVYRPVGFIPLEQLTRHFEYKWEVVSLRLRIAHSALYDFFNSENLYNFVEIPRSHEEVTQKTEKRLLQIELTRDICHITLQLIRNTSTSAFSNIIQREQLQIAYRLLDQLGTQ